MAPKYRLFENLSFRECTKYINNIALIPLNHWYRKPYTRKLQYKTKQTIGWNHWESRAKALRSCLVSTVPHVHNGRYEHAHRPFHVFITVDTRQLVAGFCPITCLTLVWLTLCFRFIYPWLSSHLSFAFVSFILCFLPIYSWSLHYIKVKNIRLYGIKQAVWLMKWGVKYKRNRRRV